MMGRSVCLMREFTVKTTTMLSALCSHGWTTSTCRDLSSGIRLYSSSAHSHQHSRTAATSVTASTEKRHELSHKTEETLPLQQFRKEDLRTMKVQVGQFFVPRTSASLAAYVNASETLTALVLMGVDLSRIDQMPEAANCLVRLNFERDVQPYVVFLRQLGLSAKQVAQVFTHSPGIFQEPLDNVEIRINYLSSKRFSDEQIVQIVSKARGLLLTATKDVDSQLGYLQREFCLTGLEVREVVSKLPKIVHVDRDVLQWSKFNFLEFLGFTKTQVKKLLLEVPRVYLENRESVTGRFDYLHNVMSLSHWDILHWPDALLTRTFILQERHEFLVLMGRDQYNPTKENFVSLKRLAASTDEDFCQTVAKAPLDQYEDFLKTL